VQGRQGVHTTCTRIRLRGGQGAHTTPLHRMLHSERGMAFTPTPLDDKGLAQKSPCDLPPQPADPQSSSALLCRPGGQECMGSLCRQRKGETGREAVFGPLR